MKPIILKCRPNSLFHFGKIAIGENTGLDDTSTYIHSDTLFSAIINLADKIFDSTIADSLVANFESGLVNISSGFYCLENKGKYIYFLPKPTNYNTLSTPKNHKAIKKVQFISKKIWEENILPDKWNSNDCIILQDKFVLHISELEKLVIPSLDKSPKGIAKAKASIRFYSINTFPKVKVHKRVSTESLYYQTNLQIADNIIKSSSPNASERIQVHFYCLLNTTTEFEEGDNYQRLLTILEVLADEGIGGERNVGCGHLTAVEVLDTPFEIMVNSVQQQYATLSLSSPNPTNNDLAKFTHYDIITRGGRRTREGGTLPLMRIKMIAEGAVCNDIVEGHIPSIATKGKTKPYLRNGKAFCVPVAVIPIATTP